MAITNAQQYRQMYRYGGDTMGGPNDKSNSNNNTGGGGGNKGKGRDLDYQMSGGKTGSTFETYSGGKNIGVDNTLAAKYGNAAQKAAANKALAKGNLFSSGPNQSFFEKTSTVSVSFANLMISLSLIDPDGWITA